MNNKKTLIIINILLISNLQAETIFSLDKKTYNGNLLILETKPFFKEIKEGNWIELSRILQSINPEINNQTESFEQNFIYNISQSRQIDTIFTDPKTKEDIIMDSVNENRIIQQTETKTVSVIKKNETKETLTCTDWTPESSTIESGVNFEQQRNCDIKTISNYDYLVDNIIVTSKTINQIENKQETRNALGNKAQSYCKVEFAELGHFTYSASLFKISFNLQDNSQYNFGSLISDQRLIGEFQNATVTSTSTYTGYNPKNAILGQGHYWLGSQAANDHVTRQKYTITFKSPVELKSVTYADLVYCHDCRGSKVPYKINLFDCNNNMIKSYSIQNQISPAYGQTGTFTFY